MRTRALGWLSLALAVSLPLAHLQAQAPGADLRASAGSGTQVPAGRGTGHWRTYGIADGLPGLDVIALHVDRDGLLWVGTDGSGVSRFDGRAFETFTTRDGLANNIVRSILQDRGGDLWFATYGGVSRYDGRAFTTYTTRDGLAGDLVQGIVEDRDGTLWFGTAAGLSRYDGSGFRNFTTADGLAGDVVAPMAEDRDGNLWVATGTSFSLGSLFDAGLARYDGSAFRTYTARDGLPADALSSWLVDTQGRLWVGTTGGLARYDGQGFTSLTIGDDLPARTGPMLEDRDGNLWFRAWNGVSRYDGRALVAFTTRDGLAHDLVHVIVEDHEGHLWFGTNGGLSRYDGDVWTTFTTADGLAHDLGRSIAGDENGHLWFGTNGGLSRYDGDTFRSFTTADGLPSDNVWAVLAGRRGNLWLGAPPHGLCRYDGRVFHTFTTDDGLLDDRVLALFEDSRGRLWVGSVGGANLYADGEFTTFAVEDTFEVSNRVTSILEDAKGDLWFGHLGGVNRYDGESLESHIDLGLAGSSVWTAVEDRDGHLWFGTRYSGVSRYDGRSFIGYTTADGLGHDGIRSSLMDRDGHLWFGTDAGVVSRYDGQTFQTLTREDGLTGHSVRAIHQDRAGCMWFVTYEGVTRFCPPQPTPPTIVVDAVIADRRYDNVAELALPSTVGLVTVAFHGVSMKTRPDGMAYRYRLRGHDDDWRTTRAVEVDYEDLTIGSYTFEVVAVDRDLAYSVAPAVLALRIQPPFERIAWIGALCIAVAVIGLQGVRIVRRDRLIQEQTRRKSEFLARMSHDLRTPMNAIIGYTRLLRRRLEGTLDERQSRNLENIQTSAGNLLSLINEILDLSRIEAGRVDLQIADVDVRALAGECAASIASLVRPGVELHQQLQDVAPIRSDRELLRKVLMNLLGNAVKFTEQGSITLSVRDVDGQVEVSVADTGMGIPAQDLPDIFEEFRQVERQGSTEKEGTGLGLAIASKAIRMLGGTITAESQEGRGTTFRIRISDHGPGA